MIGAIVICRVCIPARILSGLLIEDIKQDITSITQESGQAYFFSGYDGDSLALESQTQFLKSFCHF